MGDATAARSVSELIGKPSADMAEFLERLGRNEIPDIEFLPGTIRATIRLDIECSTGINHWFVLLARGKARVTREERAADIVIHGTEDLFDRIARGEAQLRASLFRNELHVEGDLKLMDFLARLLPGPPGSHHPREFARMGGPES